ncbi:MAG: YjbQ family protein [Deltaproteobacteria bacterium]|nr:YjbQ family protein [Deltaproteobacteria bacterium]
MPGPTPIEAIDLKTTTRDETIDITSLVRQVVKKLGVDAGICYVYCPHTTAGLTLQENSDPDVKKDLLAQLARMVPRDAGFVHSEDNSDAHIKGSLVGSSLSIPIEKGKLLLGTWQAVFFCEFDGPRSRKVLVKVIAG